MLKTKKITNASTLILLIGLFAPIAFSAFAKDTGNTATDSGESDAAQAAKAAAKQLADQEGKALQSRIQGMRDQAKQEETTDKNAASLQYQAAQIIQDVYRDLIEGQERISEAQAEGIDIAHALQGFNQAKKEAQSLEAQTRQLDIDAAKKTGAQIKKETYFATERDLLTTKELSERIDAVTKEATQTEGKIYLLGQLGGDTHDATDTLNSYKQDLANLKDRLAAGGADRGAAITDLNTLDQKITKLKSDSEQAIYSRGGTDQLFAKNYQDEAATFAQNLAVVAHVKGGETGAMLTGLASEEQASAATIADALQSIDERKQLFQVLFGVRASNLETLEAQTKASADRVASLKTIALTLEDQDLKQMLLTEADRIGQENDKLSVFIDAQQKRSSVFGWAFKFFKS